MNKGSRNKDLASTFAVEDVMMRNVAAGNSAPIGVGTTTLPGGGQPGDPTVLSAEYNDELESVGVGTGSN